MFVSLEATYRVGLGRSLDPVRDAFFVFGEATTYPTTPLPISCPRPTLAPLQNTFRALAKRYLNFFIQPVLPKHVQIFLSN